MGRIYKAIKLLIAILILVAVVGGGLYIYQACAAAPIIQKIDKTLPEVNIAPFSVTTETHVYYARVATLNEDKSVTMIGWYERDGKKWVYREGSIRLPPEWKPRIGKR